MKKTKQEAKPGKVRKPIVLNDEVYKTGKHSALGTIVRVTKSLVTVKWDTGATELFGRQGQAFHGRANQNGEADRFSLSGRAPEDIWGDKNNPSIEIVTDAVKNRIAEERAEKTKLAEELAAKQRELEATPAYQKRLANLKKYSDLLRGIGTVETSWNTPENFRIELENIPPEQMDILVDAICKARK